MASRFYWRSKYPNRSCETKHVLIILAVKQSSVFPFKHTYLFSRMPNTLSPCVLSPSLFVEHSRGDQHDGASLRGNLRLNKIVDLSISLKISGFSVSTSLHNFVVVASQTALLDSIISSVCSSRS